MHSWIALPLGVGGGTALTTCHGQASGHGRDGVRATTYRGRWRAYDFADSACAHRWGACPKVGHWGTRGVRRSPVGTYCSCNMVCAVMRRGKGQLEDVCLGKDQIRLTVRQAANRRHEARSRAFRSCCWGSREWAWRLVGLCRNRGTSRRLCSHCDLRRAGQAQWRIRGKPKQAKIRPHSPIDRWSTHISSCYAYHLFVSIILRHVGERWLIGTGHKLSEGAETRLTHGKRLFRT